jgi:hypothetical protein
MDEKVPSTLIGDKKRELLKMDSKKATDSSFGTSRKVSSPFAQSSI